MMSGKIAPFSCLFHFSQFLSVFLVIFFRCIVFFFFNFFMLNIEIMLSKKTTFLFTWNSCLFLHACGGSGWQLPNCFFQIKLSKENLGRICEFFTFPRGLYVMMVIKEFFIDVSVGRVCATPRGTRTDLHVDVLFSYSWSVAGPHWIQRLYVSQKGSVCARQKTFFVVSYHLIMYIYICSRVACQRPPQWYVPQVVLVSKWMFRWRCLDV